MNYFLYGLEQGRINQKIQSIIQDIQKDHECDIITYNLQNTSLNEVMQEAMTAPFFAERKVIVAANAQFLGTDSQGDTSLLESFLNHPLLENTLILVGNFEKPDARKKIVKLVQSTCHAISFGILNEQEKRTYILNKICELKIKANDQLKNMMAERLPLDVRVIDEQLTKCALYPDELNEEILSLLLPRPLDDDIFKMIESILKGKTKTAFQLYQDMIALNNDPIYLIAVMATSIRFYYQVKVLSLRGLGEEAIARELKAHPYRVKLTLRNVFGLSADTLLQLLDELANCDQAIKNGILPKNLAFELFLIHSQGVIR